MRQMIGMAVHYGERPIKLLEKENARQLVCDGHFAEGNDVRRGSAYFFTETIGWSHREEERIGISATLEFEKSGKFFRCVLFAIGVEQDEPGPATRAGGMNESQQRRFTGQRQGFHSGVVGQPLEVVGGERLDRRVASFPNPCDEQLHSRGFNHRHKNVAEELTA